VVVGVAPVPHSDRLVVGLCRCSRLLRGLLFGLLRLSLIGLPALSGLASFFLRVFLVLRVNLLLKVLYLLLQFFLPLLLLFLFLPRLLLLLLLQLFLELLVLLLLLLYGLVLIGSQQVASRGER
jgi:hypothetical protein